MIPFGDEEDIAVFVKDEADGAFAGGVRQGTVMDGVLQGRRHASCQIVNLAGEHLHIGRLVLLGLPPLLLATNSTLPPQAS